VEAFLAAGTERRRRARHRGDGGVLDVGYLSVLGPLAVHPTTPRTAAACCRPRPASPRDVAASSHLAAAAACGPMRCRRLQLAARTPGPTRTHPSPAADLRRERPAAPARAPPIPHATGRQLSLRTSASPARRLPTAPPPFS